MECWGEHEAALEADVDREIGEEWPVERECSYVGCRGEGEMWLWGVWVCEEHAAVMRGRATRVLVPAEDAAQSGLYPEEWTEERLKAAKERLLAAQSPEEFRAQYELQPRVVKARHDEEQ